MSNIVASTHSENADRIVENYVPAHLIAVDRRGLAEEIRRALCDATGAELAKRRQAEQALVGCNLGNVLLVCTETETFLKAYNPKRQSWARLAMVEMA